MGTACGKQLFMSLFYPGFTECCMFDCRIFLHPHSDASQRFSGEEEALNDGEVNGNWTPQEKALHEARLKAKAKRRQRKSSSRNSTSESFSESGEAAGGDPTSPKGKVATNDRKSRTGKGRGLPKKGRAELHFAAYVCRGAGLKVKDYTPHAGVSRWSWW